MLSRSLGDNNHGMLPVQNPFLVNSTHWIHGTHTLSGNPRTINNVVNGVALAAKISVNGHHKKQFLPGQRLKYTRLGVSRDFTILRSRNLTTTNPLTFTVTKTTEISIREAFTFVDSQGTVEEYLDPTDNGANPAHMVHQVLFDEWPHGLAHDKSEFDIDSFEEVGELLVKEEFAGHLLARDGEEAGSAIAGINQDVGAFVSFDVIKGKYRLHPIREETNILVLPEDIILDPLPEIEALLHEKPVTSVSFVYQDRKRKYKDSTISTDEDGESGRVGHKKQAKSDMRLVTDDKTAVIVEERRSQEELGGGSAIRVFCNRDARNIFPGQVITVPDLENEALRVSGKTIDVNSGKVVLVCFTDFYGLPVTDYEQDPGFVDPGDDTEGNSDLLASANPVPPLVEPPLLGGGSGGGEEGGLGDTRLFIPKILPLRVRDEGTAPSAIVHLSDDDTIFVPTAVVGYVTGGVLTAELTPGFSVLAQGFQIESRGPDFTDRILDLSGADSLWRMGRQILIVGDEWMFVQKFTLISGSTYRADGVIRARYGTVQATHILGKAVFILRSEDLYLLSHYFARMNETVYARIQAGDMELSEAQELSMTPASIPAPVNFRIYKSAPVWTEGVDIILKWSYFLSDSYFSGAGMQRAGDPTSVPAPLGNFTIDVLDGVTLKRTIHGIKASCFHYPYAAEDGFISGEDITFRLRHVVGGQASDFIELLVEG